MKHSLCEAIASSLQSKVLPKTHQRKEVMLKGGVSVDKVNGRDFAVIRFIYFDAVGTILHPSPSVSEIYHHYAQKHGYRVEFSLLKQRIRDAFGRQEGLDERLGWKTDETREENRWRTIVLESFPGMSSHENCFQDLYQVFATAKAWTVEPELAGWLELAQSRSIKLGLASNFDHRLRNLIREFPQLKAFSEVIISSEIGWRKPAPGFYERALKQAKQRPNQVLFLGDNLRFDVQVPREMGMRAALITEFATSPLAYLSSEKAIEFAVLL